MSLKPASWLPYLLGACCLLPFTPLRAASSDSGSGQIDVNFFYDTLKDEGSWFNTTEYGDVWQPYIAYKSDSWRPYTDGYWSYTDGGWMFVSDESFGWAVYHYGRWTRLQDIGWAWVPGTEWAPAWVTWRESKPADATGAPASGAAVSATTTDVPDNKDAPPPPAQAAVAPEPGPGPAPGGEGGNYIGWAPLPPAPIAFGTGYSYGPGVDVEFGIDPYAYAFTDYRSFGDPFLAGVIFGSDRGYYCCDHSVNITNVYYNGRGGYRGFYNGGPDYNRLRGQTARPIQQLNIQRNTSSRLVRDQVRNGTFNSIHGNQINVAAPRFSQNSVRDGRVNFARRGALPVTPVAHQFAPPSAAENPAYKQARESFNRQGEAFRAQRGNNPAAADGNRAEALATTPRAQQEERQAQQEAERAGRPGGNKPPETAARAEAQEPRPQAENHNQAAETRQAEHQSHQGSRHSRRGSGRTARGQDRSPAPRVERTGGGGHRGGGFGGGGGGEHRGGGGGGGERHGGGGGGGEHRGGGGGGGGGERHGGGGGGGGGNKKK